MLREEFFRGTLGTLHASPTADVCVMLFGVMLSYLSIIVTIYKGNVFSFACKMFATLMPTVRVLSVHVESS